MSEEILFIQQQARKYFMLQGSSVREMCPSSSAVAAESVTGMEKQWIYS